MHSCVSVSGAGWRRSLLVVVLATCGFAWAQDYPARKPGLWEMQVKTDKEAPAIARQCIDAQTDKRLQQMGTGIAGSACSKNTFKREGSGWLGESVCKMGTSTITSRSVVSGSFDSEFKMVVDAQYAPPLMGQTRSTTTITQTFKGACPAGWKPGDIEMPGMPQRINIDQFPGAPPKR